MIRQRISPEREFGLPVPRKAMRLEDDPAAPRLVTRNTGIDGTGLLLRWAKDRLAELEGAGLCGYVFKSGSPSSGMERVRVEWNSLAIRLGWTFDITALVVIVAAVCRAMAAGPRSR